LVRVGFENVKDGFFRRLLQELVRQLSEAFGGSLVSVVLFGSVARGEAGEESDVDVIVVCEDFPEGISGRVDMLLPVLDEVYARVEGRKPFIQFHPLRPDEAAKSRPIYLDVLEDGVILYDKEGFILRVLERMERKLRELGARRVHLKDGSWIWVLKPGMRLGEVIRL